LTLYFAYGSNLKRERMEARVPGARPVGSALLRGWRWASNKHGRDGSGKANLEADPTARVWGALYRLAEGDLDRLDRFEGGYVRLSVEVEESGGALRQAWTYRSNRRLEDERPFAWYLALVLEGAREHGLPEDWVNALAAWPRRPDPGPR